MLKEWQFNILFFVGIAGTIVLIFGPEFGLKIEGDPTALTGLGAILTYVLTQRRSITRRDHDRRHPPEDEHEEDDDERR